MSKPRTPAPAPRTAWGEAIAEWRPPGEARPRTAREVMIARLAAIIAEVDPRHDLYTEDLAAAIVDRLVEGARP